MVYYFSFDESMILWLLFAIPLLIFTHLYFMHHARRKAMLFGNFKALERVTGKHILTKNLLLLTLRIVVVACLIFAAAGTTLWRTGPRGPNDVILVIDASASMTTDDMNGTRIEAAKQAATEFVKHLNLTTSIGVMQYSGLTEIVVTPTESRAAVLDAIAKVQVKPIGGSDIAGAIVTGTNLLADRSNGHVLVLLTDGVASLSLYEDNPIPQALSYARQHAVVIHTIGIGSQKTGSFIPGLESQAALYDEQNLETMANATGGRYAWARDPTQLHEAFDRIAGEGSTGFIQTKLTFVLVLLALVAVFVEWGLLNTRYRIIP